MKFEDKADLFLRIGALERSISLKDKAIENTYKLAFLANVQAIFINIIIVVLD